MNRATPQDQLLTGFRWLLLLGVAAAVGRSDGNGLALSAVTLLGAAFNVMMLLLLAIGRRFRFLPELALSVDALLAVALYQLSGRSTGLLAWAGLFPILNAGLSYGRLEALGSAAGIVAVFGALSVAYDSVVVRSTLPLIFEGAVLLAAAAAIGATGQNLRSLLTARARAAEAESNRRIRQVRDRSRAIYEMASTVSATLDYERVLEAALDLGGIGLDDLSDAPQQMVSAVLLFDADQLHVQTARRFTHADMDVTAPAQGGVLKQAIATGAPAQAAEPCRDEELSAFASLGVCRSVICVPLQAGFETYGVIVFGHPRENFFDADHVQLLEAIGNQAIIALQNAQLYRDLRAEKERIVEVEEDARKKLARDLHDGPTQSVAAIAMRVNFARRLLGRDVQAASDELFKVEDLARRTTKEIRHMLFTLRPLILESQGLLAALKQLAEKTLETHGQRVIVEAESSLADRLEMGKQGVVFYIAEEAVGNARKHAQAEHIWIRLKGEQNIFVLEIQDDGVGFNVGAVDASYDQRGSLGMVNMRERTQLVNGLLRIESAEGKGTKITVFVPLDEAALDRLRHSFVAPASNMPAARPAR